MINIFSSGRLISLLRHLILEEANDAELSLLAQLSKPSFSGLPFR